MSFTYEEWQEIRSGYPEKEKSMSYDSSPAWTDNIDLPIPSCPHCLEAFGDTEESLEAIYGDSYYEPRHIPKHVFFTCCNEKCNHCDQEIAFGVVVKITLAPEKARDINGIKGTARQAHTETRYL